jgi:two-component system osmolarity sensor histidine kinase EnvZ
MTAMRAALRTSPFAPVEWMLRRLGRLLPKGLYARSLIIIIAPMVLLQSVIAYAFMERH